MVPLPIVAPPGREGDALDGAAPDLRHVRDGDQLKEGAKTSCRHNEVGAVARHMPHISCRGEELVQPQRSQDLWLAVLVAEGQREHGTQVVALNGLRLPTRIRRAFQDIGPKEKAERSASKVVAGQVEAALVLSTRSRVATSRPFFPKRSHT